MHTDTRVRAKVDKQIQYLIDSLALHQSVRPIDAFVDAEDTTLLIADQLRADPSRVRPQVRTYLDELVDGGVASRWTDVYGPSQNSRRDQQYLVKPGRWADHLSSQTGTTT